MRAAVVTFVLVTLCLISVNAQSPEKLAAAWDKEHVTTIPPSDVRHTDLKRYIERLSKMGISTREVGRSYANREIYQVEWGKGPLKVFMWSQMHGDEPTATSALIDMFAYLQNNRGRDGVKKIEQALTIRAVPMLNPDGAEAYQRRSLQDIDINRDAIDLRTPEARLLKQLRDDWNPAIGFNLHNQQDLTTAGRAPMQATISLLAVFGDPQKTMTAGQDRNERIAAQIADALRVFIPGHIARYSDEWTGNAFGDNFGAWGTPTVLIETAALEGKDEMYLVRLNFVAFLTALESLATGSYRTYPPDSYLNLPQNASGGLVNYVFRRANIVDPVTPATIRSADIAAVTQRRRASFAKTVIIRAVGELAGLHGLVEYDASDYNVIQRLGHTAPGELAELLFYKRDRPVDWTATDIEKQFPPDAIFSGGKWVKGGDLFQKK